MCDAHAGDVCGRHRGVAHPLERGIGESCVFGESCSTEWEVSLLNRYVMQNGLHRLELTFICVCVCVCAVSYTHLTLPTSDLV